MDLPSERPSVAPVAVAVESLDGASPAPSVTGNVPVGASRGDVERDGREGRSERGREGRRGGGVGRDRVGQGRGGEA